MTAQDTTTGNRAKDFFSDEIRSLALVLFPWIPAALLDVWIAGYIESGKNAEAALAFMRRDPRYEQFFPGNLNDDGTVRHAEGTYQAIRESYENTLISNRLNPAVFRDEFAEAIRGGVSPAEFTSRIEAARELVQDRLPQARAAYQQYFGTGPLTDEAVFAMFINPAISERILNRNVAIAEIGAEGILRDFDVDLAFAERAFQSGLERRAASEFFGQAQEQVPILDRLARRFGDSGDRDVDLSEFSEGILFSDVRQRQRFRRLLAAERSQFSSQGSFRRDQSGGVSGLRRL